MVDLGELPEPDAGAAAAVRARAAAVLRPAGAMARLDEVAAWLAGWPAWCSWPTTAWRPGT